LLGTSPSSAFTHWVFRRTSSAFRRCPSSITRPLSINECETSSTWHVIPLYSRTGVDLLSRRHWRPDICDGVLRVKPYLYIQLAWGRACPFDIWTALIPR
jgi:hypothetical protein